ncbi:60S ribosomal protein L39 [Coemansia sp. Benny D115]|nr:60S ribosomal protein L39 [Coemansia sp. Benny D115]
MAPSSGEADRKQRISRGHTTLMAMMLLPSNKSFRVKRILGKKLKQSRPMPNWFRAKPDTKRGYSTKRRHWRRTKLNI